MKETVSRFVDFLRLYDAPLTRHKGAYYVHEEFLASFLGFSKSDIGEFNSKDRYRRAGYLTEEVLVEKAAKIVEGLHSHPQQYNAQLAMKGKNPESEEYVIDHKLLKPYRKKHETYILAAIHARYGKDFSIFSQYRVLNYRTDGVLFLLRENVPGMYVPKEDREEGNVYPSGILLEIDEGDHFNYDPEDEKIRHDIIQVNRYSLVRTGTGDSFKELCIKIDAAKQEQQMIFSSNIDPKELWDELRAHCIEKDFFRIYRKCLNPDEKFCISSSDLALYLETRHDNLKRIIAKITTKFPHEYSQSCSSLVRSKIGENKHGGNNKKVIYMTAIGMQLVLMRLKTSKAQKAQLDLITCYQTAFKLALALKNQLASSIADYKSDADRSLAQMKRREDKKHRADMNKLKFFSQKRDKDVRTYVKTISGLEKKNKELEDMSVAKDERINLLSERIAILEGARKISDRRIKCREKCKIARKTLKDKKKDLDRAEGKLREYVAKGWTMPGDEGCKNKIGKYDEKVWALYREVDKAAARVEKYKSMIRSLKRKESQLVLGDRTEDEFSGAEDEFR